MQTGLRTAALRRWLLWERQEDDSIGALLAHFLRDKTWVGDDGTVIYRGAEAAA